MVTTAGTVCEAIRLLRSHGAKSFYVSATHAVFAGPAVERLKTTAPEQVVVTDTIPLEESVRTELPNLEVRSVARLMGQAILRIHRNQSVSALFENDCSRLRGARGG